MRQGRQVLAVSSYDIEIANQHVLSEPTIRLKVNELTFIVQEQVYAFFHADQLDQVMVREDGPALLPVEEEREEIDMGKITITEKQEAIIRRLNDPLYTVEFLKEWVNRNDNVFINAPAALQAMGASGFFAAVRAIERAKESDGENT